LLFCSSLFSLTKKFRPRAIRSLLFTKKSKKSNFLFCSIQKELPRAIRSVQKEQLRAICSFALSKKEQTSSLFCFLQREQPRANRSLQKERLRAICSLALGQKEIAICSKKSDLLQKKSDAHHFFSLKPSDSVKMARSECPTLLEQNHNERLRLTCLSSLSRISQAKIEGHSALYLNSRVEKFFGFFRRFRVNTGERGSISIF